MPLIVPSPDLTSLFPNCVELEAADEEAYSGPLSPAEEILVAHAAHDRRAEFRAGRTCARAALARLGVEADTIGSSADRVPLWPLGIVGSITHCTGFCAAAVAQTRDIQSLGLDVEFAMSFPSDLAEFICSADERQEIDRLGIANFDRYALAFSAKEAFYKCYYAVTRTFLEFKDVRIHFQTSTMISGKFWVEPTSPKIRGAALMERIQGRWFVGADHVFCGAFLLPLGKG